MTIVVVQCRLDSSRLPRKALLPLAGRPLVAWTLAAMKKVPADHHVLAVDQDSYLELSPVALDCGWDIFAGSKDDVLERFCTVATHYRCLEPSDLILRATADNPFLFHEAAVQLLEEMERQPCDYITFTGLPHGSGVEVFNARSLMEACGMTADPYDHEHVGPAFYRHPQDFASIMLPAPAHWQHPDLRTTVDTASDYRRCLRIVRQLSNSRCPPKPYEAQEIISAFSKPSVAHPVLCVPAVAKGRGTGHLCRCLDIARKIGADLLIPELEDSFFQLRTSASLSSEVLSLMEEALEQGLEVWQFRNALPEPGEYNLILTDYFSLDKALVQSLSAVAPVAAIDEGSSHTLYCDYLLDIIPSHRLGRRPNLRNSSLIPLPKNRRAPVWCQASQTHWATDDNELVDASIFSKILVSVGGEDPLGLSLPAALALASLEKQVTVIVSNPLEARKAVSAPLQQFVRVVPPVANLREKLHQYDLVVTHYGFTAFEALAAGCAVILLGTSSLHLSLGQKYGFATLSQDSVSAESFRSLLVRPWILYPSVNSQEESDAGTSAEGKGEESLEDFVVRLAAGSRIPCPVCGKQSTTPNPVLARTAGQTFRRCSDCGIIYLGWTLEGIQPSYSSDYFFQDYKAQYGKTYLEDFDSIKNQGIRRMSIIDALFWLKKRGSSKSRRHQSFIPAVLDIGCAYGPFLSAGAEAGWQVFGTDISPSAVEHVQKELRFPAVCTPFPDFNPVKEFGVGQFEAVTMWYVIEHFRQLGPVLEAVSRLLKLGGVFAFSTPSASGMSARFSPESFFANSPTDHYTLWEPGRTKEILRRFGFKVARIVSTGHHPERHPALKVKETEGARDSFLYSTLHGVSRCFKLGDTFEVYCIKTEERD